ncbi:peptide ABC transporter ATP-binding protein [Candidatus Bathyarchaeota archaeon]|nr:MAG: peptide ABC transporter ATP-binding protein [Candidatus Bathyarchaeota archaeon]
MTDVLIECKNVTKCFPLRGVFAKKEKVHAVEGVSFYIKRGETLGLVGESGCGKTTLARIILGLILPTSGSVFFEGNDIFKFSKRELKEFRRRTAMVFQDPFASLNPRMVIADIVGEPLVIHGIAYGEDKDEMVKELLERVGLKEEHMYRYPHEFSGGQRQRIAIARALAADPEFIVLDEPTSALDVSVQAKILNLLNRLKEELGLTYLFISHDLSVIRHISDRVGVMYLGKLVEEGKREEIFSAPLHPYTAALLATSPKPDPRERGRKRFFLKGEVPSAINPPGGCRFHTRCPFAESICASEAPHLERLSDTHRVACHYPLKARREGEL